MLQNAIRNLKNQEGEGEGGFTLIELLVVILIIGILAAIALPTFLGQSDKAKDSSAKSDVRNAVTQVESCFTDATSSPTYADCVGANTYKGQGSVVTAATTAGFTAAQKSKGSKEATFTIEKLSDGTFKRTCDKPGEGGCKAQTPAVTGVGTW